MRAIDTGFDAAVWSAAVSPDGRWLAAHPGRRDVPISVWDLYDPTAPPIEIPSGRTGQIAFSPDGRYFARCGAYQTTEGVMVRPFPGNGKPRRAFPKLEVRPFAFTPDGRELFGLDRSRPHRWDLATWSAAPLQLDDCPDPTLREEVGLAFSPNGTRLAITIPQLVDRRAQVVLGRWDYPTGKLIGLEEVNAESSPALVFSPDGATIACQLRDGVLILDAETGRERNQVRPKLAQMPPGTRLPAVSPPAFTPDGRLLALGGYDGTVRFYDTTTWAEHRVYDWVPALGDHRHYPAEYGRPVTRVLFTADGTRAIAAYHFQLFVWDLDV
jgi:WD40 repeat protein